MKLIVTIDTEEEFDWSAPVNPSSTSVSHFTKLPPLQDLFDECGVRPTYVIDYPVATQPESISVLKEFVSRGTCEIGAHLHPWVNPPVDEEICPEHTFLSNLPLALQERKLEVLTKAIQDNLELDPKTFKAGRYGFTKRLVPKLVELGYSVDTSVLAYTNMSFEKGPDFSTYGNDPFWIRAEDNDAQVLEVPCTVGFTRHPFSLWSRFHNSVSQSKWLSKTRIIGLLWQTGLFRRSVLTPEGTEIATLLSVLKSYAKLDPTLINITLHSPSIEPGHTQYVQSVHELDSFLERLREVLLFSVHELSATPMTIQEFSDSFQQNQQ